MLVLPTQTCVDALLPGKQASSSLSIWQIIIPCGCGTWSDFSEVHEADHGTRPDAFGLHVKRVQHSDAEASCLSRSVLRLQVPRGFQRNIGLSHSSLQPQAVNSSCTEGNCFQTCVMDSPHLADTLDASLGKPDRPDYSSPYMQLVSGKGLRMSQKAAQGAHLRLKACARLPVLAQNARKRMRLRQFTRK